MYVVEGSGGENGHLRVSSRYVILPGGRRIDVPADPDRVEPVRGLRRRRPRQARKAFQSNGKSRFGRAEPKAPKPSASSVKKFVAATGTSR
jgi:hypothetical protein